MAKLYSRNDLRLAALATLSGILTAMLVLVVWFRGVGAGPALVPPEPGTAPAAEDPFIGALRRQVSERLTSRPVSTKPLRGPLSFRASRVVWEVPGTGERFARADAVTGTVDVAAASRGDVVLGTVRLENPTLTLRSDGRRWNYERPLAGLLDGPEGGGARADRPTFRVAALAIDGGVVNVDMPGNDFTLEGVEARLADVELSGPALPAPRMRLVSASATLERPDAQAVRVAAGRGTLRFPNATTEFDITTVTLAGTTIEEFEGVWDPARPGYGVTATGRAPSVQFADIRFLAPERIPEEGTASFRFAIAPLEGDGTAVRLTELRAASGSSRISGALAAEVFPGSVAVERVDLRLEPVALALLEPFTGPLPYTGTLTGTLEGPGSDIRLDIVADLRAENVAEPFSTRLVGAVALGRDGLEFRDLVAELRGVPLAALRAYAPGLPLSGKVSGTVALNGPPRRSPLRLDVRLELGTGLATVAGTLDLTGAVPRYDLSGRLVGIDLQSIMAPAAPPVLLSAAFTLAGAGFDPATAAARVSLDGGFTGWEAEPGDSISLRASVNGGVMQVERLVGSLATAELSASGRWQFVEPISGAVEYRLAVASLEPFGPYIPMIGDSAAAGSLRAEGTVSGPLDRLRLAGTFGGEGLRVGDWRAGRVASEYSVAFTGALPEFEVELTGSDIGTPTAGNYTTLEGTIALASPRFDLDVRADRVGGGQVAIVAEGTIPREGARTVYLQRAFFDLQEGRWELTSPASISWGVAGGGLRVADFRLRNAQTEGRIEVDGTVFPLDRLDARLVVADLPVDQVQDLLGRNQRMTGRLTADLTIRPPANSPDIEGTFRLVNGSIEGIAFTQFEGRIDYANGVARTELLAALDSAAGRFEVRGTLPLRISFADSLQFGLTEGGPLDATLVAERVSLRPLGLLVTRVRDLDGVLDGTVTLAGTVESPQLGGQLAVSGGAVRVPDLNQRFDSIAGVIAFSGRQARVADFRIRRDGWARVNGTATFEELDRPVFDLRADLDGFQPIGVDEHPDAGVTGNVTLVGELDALVLSGAVEVDDGYVAVPQFGRAFDDDFIDIADPTPVLGRDADETGKGTWLSNMRIADMRVTFGEGAWFEAAEATAQLAGTVTVNKNGDEVRVFGTLEGERGTYTLVAGPIVRRFEVTRAQVRFFGEPEPNPAIDIVARRVVLDPAGRRVEVEVRITGTMQTPRLGLASADAPNIPQSELLSFLLFGRPTFALGQDVGSTSEDLLQQTFLGGFAELASIELERTLSADLGLQLDLFQVRFGQGFSGLTTPTFVLGRQLSDDFFLTVESGINALFAEEGATASNWAIRLEWAIDRRSSLQLGLEPVNRARLLRGIGAALPLGQRVQQQLYVEYRRRWVY